MKKNNSINLMKNPYRGILTEMAKEENCTPQNIYNALRRDKNLRIMERYAEKIAKIDKRSKKLEACNLN